MFITVIRFSIQQRVKRMRVDMHRTPEAGGMAGVLPLCPFKMEQRGRKCLFIAVSLVISWFIKIYLKQIYCSYSGTHKILNEFL